MKVRTYSVGLLIAIILILTLLPVSVGAQAVTETTITITDIVSGAALVDKNFTTDLQVSITNSGSPEVGIMGVELWVSFDPTVVEIFDYDGDPGNGTQVEMKNGFFDGNLVVVANEVYYDVPSVPHPTECDTQACLHVAASHTGGSGAITNGAGTIATITWVGLAEGSVDANILVIEDGIQPGSMLADDNGEYIPIDDTSVPDVTVTVPGTVEGTVLRQGTRTDHAGSDIVALEMDGGTVTASSTITTGVFTLDVPLGGTYSINANYPGYLNAQKNEVTVSGSTVDIGSTTLVGGDVNDDNCINILDIVSIVVQFGESELEASDPQDINDDGTVNIFDLTIAAGNFGRCGPTAWTP